MRRENDPAGGNLADTIMVISIDPKQSKVAMISVPRDLYVTVPGTQDKQKINAVHALGEKKKKGQGLEDMKAILSDVTGLSVDYAASINFEGFKQLIDTIGGVEITLDQPFSEVLQFKGIEQRCDLITFTVPSGNYEEKRIQRKNGTYYANPKRYPLCYAKATATENLECGGSFTLPAGKQTLSGDSALCYVRSRKTSNDFERAKRQQIIVQLVKDKVLSSETLMNFDKLNQLLDNLGDNVRTDLRPWEMKRFFDVYKEMQNMQIYQRVLENSEEGLLYTPPENGAGYILLPIGDNYDRIRDMAKNIFNLPPQSDIKPKS
jgi:LCP family protein required for cell wall assembly